MTQILVGQAEQNHPGDPKWSIYHLVWSLKCSCYSSLLTWMETWTINEAGLWKNHQVWLILTTSSRRPWLNEVSSWNWDLNQERHHSDKVSHWSKWISSKISKISFLLLQVAYGCSWLDNGIMEIPLGWSWSWSWSWSCPTNISSLEAFSFSSDASVRVQILCWCYFFPGFTDHYEQSVSVTVSAIRVILHPLHWKKDPDWSGFMLITASSSKPALKTVRHDFIGTLGQRFCSHDLNWLFQLTYGFWRLIFWWSTLRIVIICCKIE